MFSTRERFVLVAASSLLVGMLLAKYGYEASSSGLLFLPFLVIIFRQKRFLLALLLLSFCLQLGLWRGQTTYESISSLQSVVDQEIQLQGVVEESATYHESGQVEFDIRNLSIHAREFQGRIRIRTHSGTDFQRGDIVLVSGKLRSGFGNRQGYMHYAQSEVLLRNPNAIEELRSHSFATAFTILPDDLASLGLGFLVGVRSLLSEDLTEALSITGLTHIVAVSGYNLTILVRLTRRLFNRFSRFMASFSSLSLITSFILLTGISPSIQRATIVTGLALTAWFFGRKVEPFVLLLVSAAISATINPLYLWYDIGWYLSFTAFFGVLILAPAIQARYFSDRELKTIGQILLETTCAQLLTMPIIVAVFGRFSAIALLANLLVLPLIPLSMLFTTLGIVGYWLSPLLGSLLIMPAYAILRFITDITKSLARLSWAENSFEMNIMTMLLLYVIIFGFTTMLYMKYQGVKQRSIIE